MIMGLGLLKQYELLGYLKSIPMRVGGNQASCARDISLLKSPCDLENKSKVIKSVELLNLSQGYIRAGLVKFSLAQETPWIQEL